MITGHLALAYAGGGRLRERRLLWLFGAALAPDMVDVALALREICSPYGLYSHALPALAIEAPIAAAVCWMVTKDRRVTLAAALLVLLHLPLDFVTGAKVWWPHAAPLGLDLYKHPIADVLLEVPMLAAGWWFARRTIDESSIWMNKRFIVALMALQCLLNVSKLIDWKRPITSQSDACRASYESWYR